MWCSAKEAKYKFCVKGTRTQEIVHEWVVCFGIVIELMMRLLFIIKEEKHSHKRDFMQILFLESYATTT